MVGSVNVTIYLGVVMCEAGGFLLEASACFVIFCSALCQRQGNFGMNHGVSPVGMSLTLTAWFRLGLDVARGRSKPRSDQSCGGSLTTRASRNDWEFSKHQPL